MIIRRLRQFWQAPFAVKVALVEAAVFLLAAQLLTKLVPYRWWSGLLGRGGAVEALPADKPNDGAVRAVAWAIHTVARRLPWPPVCLPRAMAAKWMLARRHVACTLVLGIRRAGTDGAAKTELHVWLRAGDQTITGGEAMQGFTAIAHYGTGR